MTTVSLYREYDQSEVLKRIRGYYPNLNFDGATVDDVDVEAPIGRQARQVTITLRLRLEADQFEHVFENPVR